MKRRLGIPLVLLTAIALVWRAASRRRRLPCPIWAGWLLENPLRDWLWSPWSLIGKAGITSAGRVLEVGPGIGYYSIPVAGAVPPGGHLVCLDLQVQMLAALKQRVGETGVSNIDLVRGDATRLPFRDGVFERSLLITVLGEVPERRVALQEQARVLAPGGLLAVGEQFPDPHYQRRRTVAALATEAGLSVRGVHPWTPGHLTLLSPPTDH